MPASWTSATSKHDIMKATCSAHQRGHGHSTCRVPAQFTDNTSSIFGFLLGSTLSGAAVYYYILEEYRVSNELLTEDIYVRLLILASPVRSHHSQRMTC